MREFNREFKKIFKETQRRLGKMEPGWKIGPIKIEGDDYPQTTCNEITKCVVVRVTKSTLEYPTRRTYQLTHESVHCLSPRDKSDTLFFEEGLANWYTLTNPALPEEYREESKAILDPLLAKPFQIFCELNPTYQRISALRAECPGLDEVTVELIIKHFGASETLAKRLMDRLPSYRPSVMK